MDNFQWTDELVKEFAYRFIETFDGKLGQSKLEAFKASKQQVKEWEILLYEGESKFDKDNRIYSVRRNSDREVFTIGDKVCITTDGYHNVRHFNIEEFYSTDGFMFVKDGVQLKGGWNISALSKVKEPVPLFTKKPPIGLMPRNAWDENRYQDIEEAIKRYLDEGKNIPTVWIAERYELNAKLNK